jgi:hypothetical protein
MAELQAAIDAYLALLPGNTPIDVPIVEHPASPTPPWFEETDHPPAYLTEPPAPERKRFGAAQKLVLAISLFAGIGIGLTATRALINDEPTAEAHTAPPAAAIATPPPAPTVQQPVPNDEQWPDQVEPSKEDEQAVDQIANPTPPTPMTIDKAPKPVTAPPRPTIRRSPPHKRTSPPPPPPADTEDLYDSR